MKIIWIVINKAPHIQCYASVCDPEKNQVQNMDLKKARCIKLGHCYSKREEARLPLLFLKNNDPVFSHPTFIRSIFWT